MHLHLPSIVFALLLFAIQPLGAISIPKPSTRQQALSPCILGPSRDTIRPQPTFTPEDARQLRRLERTERKVAKQEAKLNRLDKKRLRVSGQSMAIASFVVSLLGVSFLILAGVLVPAMDLVNGALFAFLFALTLGIVAMRNLKGTIRSGRKLAVAGFVISTAVLASMLIVLIALTTGLF